MATNPISQRAVIFHEDGYARMGELLSPAEVDLYRSIYDRFLNGEIDCGDKRSDLGAGSARSNGAAENITQIMWPSELYPRLLGLPLHERGLALARELIGDDAVLDFDMLIDKAPRTAVPTPWHQDAAYWVGLPDTRAVSIWVALDESTLDNGCMWYVRGSHETPIRAHRSAGAGGGAIECECSEDEPGAMPLPLAPGHAAAHAGGTLHYSRGNTTDGHRRAYILNYRPADMVRLEREKGMDHGLQDNARTVRNAAAR
ncbi:phytanoyl-CoA dioxygenase family protein [Streptomyces atratus]|uniref:phytanoyl-CoA dioxygenase family protein n=1 Tax=Streptomyces atratus TaxID=1893 RepID=UPI00224CD31C|nr:phytanoyl-CoA dioxygenase family protein [Streptomyces atratus]MCX5338665.1 phytanoyl-CoA dioxygenase family protein [Streptomyces atratus]